MKRTCKQCGKEFVITQSEINFYKSKNLSIPKRCKECRQSNKKRRENAEKAGTSIQRTPVAESVPKTKSTPVTKIVTAVLIVIAVIYAVFFGDSNDNQSNMPNATSDATIQTDVLELEFRSEKLLNEHYEKHGIEMGFSSAEEYEEAAEDVVENSDALRKTEAEDGDFVYYLEETNEFVIISPDGYIRTYFCPSDGIDYYNRQ